MEVHRVNCLFCALPCSPDFVINKSKTTSSPLAFGGDDDIIEEHLKAVFILRKVLKIPQEVLCQFLVKGNGQFYPELWFNVCESCGESVTQFYAVLKQISKLERELTTIQTELKGRIEESRTVDNKDFVWVKIRDEALKDRSSEVVTEEWRILVVKTENESSLTGETHHETECDWKCPDKDYNREKIPIHSHSLDDEVEDETFAENNENMFANDERDSHSFQPSAAQQSSSSPLTTPDDDDIEDIKFVTDFNPLDFQLPNRNPNHSRSNVSTVSRAKGYFYACQQCSYQCNTKSVFEAHLLLHKEGSGAIPCYDCGRPVLPDKMEGHRCRHSVIGTYRQRSRAWKVRKSKAASQPSVNGSNESVAQIGTSSSNLSTGKYYYQCKQCPFESNSSVGFDKHVKLHGNGSGAVPCEDCGFYLDPTKIGRHRAKRHYYRRDQSAKKKTLRVKKKELK